MKKNAIFLAAAAMLAAAPAAAAANANIERASAATAAESNLEGSPLLSTLALVAVVAGLVAISATIGDDDAAPVSP